MNHKSENFFTPALSIPKGIFIMNVKSDRIDISKNILLLIFFEK
jgi:hypothetical protein